jgi:hypothetical protein
MRNWDTGVTLPSHGSAEVLIQTAKNSHSIFGEIRPRVLKPLWGMSFLLFSRVFDSILTFESVINLIDYHFEKRLALNYVSSNILFEGYL